MFCDITSLIGPAGGGATPLGEPLEAALGEARVYMAEAEAMLSPLFERMAFVLPRAWWSLWWSGFYAVHAQSLRLTLFTDVAEAWAFLGAPSDVRDEVAALHAALLRAEGLPRKVEAALYADPKSTLAELAKRVGVSARSLQRALTASGETFVALRDRVRLDLAERQLGAGKLVKEVASTVGFASASHFGAWYRSRRGTTPGRV